MRKVYLSGIPSSAGGHFPGMERAPAHLRRLGLIEQLRAESIDVEDLGDLPTSIFSVDNVNPDARNVDAVTANALAVKRRTEQILELPAAPFLFLGGDCTLTIGVVAALKDDNQTFGVIYIDGHTDLSTPETSYSGIMDGMVAAHLFGRGHERLQSVSDTCPMIDADQFVYFGYDPLRQEEAEKRLMKDLGVCGVPVAAVLKDPVGTFGAASEQLRRCDRVIVHTDIDVLHFPKHPYANFPEYNGQGLLLPELQKILNLAFQLPNFSGCILTEFNPDRDPRGDYGREIISMIVEASKLIRDGRNS